MVFQRRAPLIEPDQPDAARIAKSLRDDFIKLMGMFDRQLRDDPAANDHKSSMKDARAAAERGLRLSEDLCGLLNEDR